MKQKIEESSVSYLPANQNQYSKTKGKQMRWSEMKGGAEKSLRVSIIFILSNHSQVFLLLSAFLNTSHH